MKRRKDNRKDCVTLKALIVAQYRAKKAQEGERLYKQLYHEAAVEREKAFHSEKIEKKFSGYLHDCLENVVLSLYEARRSTPEKIGESILKYGEFQRAAYQKFLAERKQLKDVVVEINGKTERYVI